MSAGIVSLYHALTRVTGDITDAPAAHPALVDSAAVPLQSNSPAAEPALIERWITFNIFFPLLLLTTGMPRIHDSTGV
jgi:hypothetical protein